MEETSDKIFKQASKQASKHARRNLRSARDNGGFTLVELIVVIVILAVLAAILVPALLGYIDKAKEEQYILKARYALTATQSVLSEMYAKEIPINNFDVNRVRELVEETELNSVWFVYFGGVAQVDGGYKWQDVIDKNVYTIKGACYIYQVNEGDNYKILYCDGSSWTKLEEEASEIGKNNWSGARKIVYFNIFEKYYQNGFYAYQKYIQIK